MVHQRAATQNPKHFAVSSRLQKEYQRRQDSIEQIAMKISCSVVSLLLLRCVTGASAGSASRNCGEKDWETHPVLCGMVQRKQLEPQVVASELRAWANDHGLLVDLRGESREILTQRRRLLRQASSENSSENQLPVVLAHGMGDSCFNDGMKHITQQTSLMLGGVYAVCVPTGATRTEDTNNGYFLNMDANVDNFAQAIQQDEKLQKGFHAIGFSQGNNVIRGYIERYNTPTVHSFLSVNGVNAGIGAVPYCRPKANRKRGASVALSSWCNLLMEQASHRAYTDFAQEHSFQANYWRDPRPSMWETYQEYSQLATWNNEAKTENQTLKENYGKTQKFIWVLATEDGMVWPKEGEQWGCPDPDDPFNKILPMNETEWYQKDLFGLKTAEEAGKNAFESFPGDHLAFDDDQFTSWVNKYLRP